MRVSALSAVKCIFIISSSLLIASCSGSGGGSGDDVGNNEQVNFSEINNPSFRYIASSAVTDVTTEDWQTYFQLQMETALEPINSLNGLLDETIDVTYSVCGFANAYYDFITRDITICDEFVEAAFRYFEDDYDAAISAINFVLYHEIAHALIDVKEIPVIGNAESSADAIATVFAGKTGRAISAVVAAIFLSTDTVSYGDEHIGGEDRAGDIICWAVGSDTNLLFNSSIAQLVAPYQQANRNCIDEYEELALSVDTLLPEASDLTLSELTIPSDISPADPTPAKTESQAASTEFTIAQLSSDTHYWLCERPSAATVSYSFYSDGYGLHIHDDYGFDAYQLSFTYTILGENKVGLLYEYTDGTYSVENIYRITFSTADTMSAISTSDGDLNCAKTVFASAEPPVTVQSFRGQLASQIFRH